jgi:NAD(P)-dependent dehydrogenase (short-subunit alcohol dehydrogenase family)
MQTAGALPAGTYTMFQGNLSSYDVVRAMHAAVVAKLGPIDILFSNHGQTGQMLGRGGNIEDLRLEEFEAAWKTNTASHFLVSPSPILYRKGAHHGAARTAVCASYGREEVGACRLLC